MIRNISFCFFVFVFFSGYSQELNCTVEILTQQVQSDKTVFEKMQKSVYEFMNNTKWTGDEFGNEERIECSILINISERIGSDEFKATMQIQSRRPVFGSSYATTILNHNDNDIQFKYAQFDQLTFSESTYQSEITSLLAFYAYMILGYDYDTFELNGGNPYFQKALAVVNTAQSSPFGTGWQSFKSNKNRYWLVNNHLDQVFKPLRNCMYTYHRLGLDVFHERQQDARQEIANAIDLLVSIHSARPNSYNMQVFFVAKFDELVKMFTPAPQEQKAKVVEVLQKLDPGHTAKYQSILTSN